MTSFQQDWKKSNSWTLNHQRTKNKSTPLPQQSEPNMRVHIDLFGPLKTSHSGKKYIICITDAFSRFAELVAIPDKTAETVGTALFERWLCRHGLPLEIISDQGKEFCNEVVDKLLDLMNIKKTKTAPYHPQTNAHCEVINKTIAQYLKTQVDKTTLNWELYIAPMAFAYNTSFHRSIKSTPLKITFGVEARTPDFDQKKIYGEDLPTEMFQRLWYCQNLARQNATEAEEKAITRNTINPDKKLMPRSFKVGDLVLLKIKDLKKDRKLCEEWKGPYIVTQVNDNSTAKIKTKFGKHEHLYNFNMLKMYKAN